MAGVYIHIPFCLKACHYCDFHFSTSLGQKNDLLAALLKELAWKGAECKETVQTVYLGGGTPSLLHAEEIRYLLQSVGEAFQVMADAEITLEANPDDINANQLKAWRDAGVNRLSIGIQSFRDIDLQWMNRAHSAEQAFKALDWVAEAGFDNYSIDLIFGLPGLDLQAWQQNLEWALSRSVPHVSAYALTIEPRTALADMIRKKKCPDISDTEQAAQYLLLMDLMEASGYEQYEISSFCLPGRRSRHNSSYWRGESYFGIGPSAHSFDGTKRSWNIAHNAGYIRAIAANRIPEESETLTENQQVNEFIMTRLRTTEGIQLDEMVQQFGIDERSRVLSLAEGLREKGVLIEPGKRLFLSREGRLFADQLAATLFR